jgi:hypothetical protein
MPRNADLMSRLAAADPLPDAEQLDPDAQREAEALLARVLATPAAPDGGQRRAWYPRLPRWTVATAAVACAAAVAFIALNLVDADAPGPGGIEQAVAARSVAALTRDHSVYHVLQRRRATGNVPSGAPRPFLLESWHSSDGRFHEKIFADRAGRRGRLLEEVAGTRPSGRRVGAVLRYYADQNKLYAEGLGSSSAADKLPLIDPVGDPGTTLRALEARGALQVAGVTRVGTRRGYRLISDPIHAEGGEQRFEYVVDSVTYLPLSQRWSMTRGSQRFGLVSDFLTYERLPLDAHRRTQLDLDPHPDATCTAEAGQPSKQDLGFANPCRPSRREGSAPTP